jgi:hypothetical protein
MLARIIIPSFCKETNPGCPAHSLVTIMIRATVGPGENELVKMISHLTGF